MMVRWHDTHTQTHNISTEKETYDHFEFMNYFLVCFVRLSIVVRIGYVMIIVAVVFIITVHWCLYIEQQESDVCPFCLHVISSLFNIEQWSSGWKVYSRARLQWRASGVRIMASSHGSTVLVLALSIRSSFTDSAVNARLCLSILLCAEYNIV